MKKLSKIDESVWGDLRKKSSGEVIRKEDELIIGFGISEMYDYLRDSYKDKVYWIDGDKKGCIDDGSIGMDPVEGISMYFDYGDDDKLAEIVMFYTIKSFSEDPKEYPEFFKKLSNTFNVSIYNNKPEFSKQWSIRPKSGELTNKTAIDVIEFFLNNEINESAWGDMRKRSSGETIRKEDDINNLDRDGLYEYIFDLYEQINPFPTPLKSQTSQTYTYFSIPIFKSNHKAYRLDCTFDNSKISKITLMASDADVKDFKQILIDNFDCILRDDGALKITAKDGTVSNQVCMDLIKVIVENAPGPLLKKRDV